MSTLSDPDVNGEPASAEYTVPAGYGTMRLREHAVPFGAYVDAEPAVRRARPDYRARTRDMLARVAAVRRALDDDQREIDRLRRETRCIIDGLLAA